VKNTILAAAAVLTLALTMAPGFAAGRSATNDNNSGSGSVANHCADILAAREGHSPADVRYCESLQH
jgi:hypothetical protein